MASSPSQHRGFLARPLWAGVAGLVIGAVIVAFLAAAGIPGHRVGDDDEVLEGQAAARAFIDTWRRSRLATWSVDSVFTRTPRRGRPLTAQVHSAQRPPDRLHHGLGTVNARRGDVELVCGGGDRGADTLRCREGKALRPYEEEVEAELKILRQYVIGPDALYAVRRESGGCFALRLRFVLPAPPYGTAARFCFDPRTLAPVRSEIRRDEGIDVTVAVNVNGDPTEADLAPPPVAVRT